MDQDHTLEFLLAFDGRIHLLQGGYWLKFEIKRVKASKERPYGVQYSFTLHNPRGKRLLGFDNAHAPPKRRGQGPAPPRRFDHWHRTEGDKGRPYAFTDAEGLVRDFFRETQRVLKEHGLEDTVISEESRKVDRNK